jgi:VIT1/CCC1 family predicted Fe2+/Mn2+ transporter
MCEQQIFKMTHCRHFTAQFWHYYWLNRYIAGYFLSGYFGLFFFFIHHLSSLMLILSVTLGLFLLGGTLISLSNALSRRNIGPRR